MSKSGSFNVTVDASAVVRLADALDVLSPENFNELAVKAVNVTADNVYDLAVPRMITFVNLSDSYVRDRMKVEHAVTRAEAKIVAAKDSAHETLLSRYNAELLTTPTKVLKGRKGDKSRGIPPGMKSAGVSVEVLKGVTKVMPGAFLLKLKGGGDVGIATHPKGGGDSYRVRYGPSVYQLFRNTAVNLVDEAGDMLEMTLVTTVNKFMDEALQ